MRYMLLIYAHEGEWESYSETEQAEVMRGHAKLTEYLIQNRKYETCDALEPTRSATTVRVRSGKMLLTDGPFAETKEQFGGYYIVDAQDLDDALAIAARIPTARTGSVEVRPLRERPEG